jgi:hypothetical protein
MSEHLFAVIAAIVIDNDNNISLFMWPKQNYELAVLLDKCLNPFVIHTPSFSSHMALRS